MQRLALRFLLCLLCLLGVVALKWQAVHDPQYWDALGCYVVQARFIARHGLDLAAYHELPYLRPPIFTGTLALALRLLGPSREVLHVTTFLFGGLALPATWMLVRRLGGRRSSAAVAALACLASPIYLAQLGIVQSDLPAAALTTLAWAALVGRRTFGFVVWASLAVLTKESAAFLCGPAALFLWQRAVRSGGRRFSCAALTAALPALIPGVVLASWLLVHGLFVGRLVSAVHRGYVGPEYLTWSLFHNFVDGGRVALVLLAALPVWEVLRQVRPQPGRQPERFPVKGPGLERDAILYTALAAVVLPLFFPAPLPRYMVLSLPLFAALSALGLERLPVSGWRPLAATLLIGFLGLGAGGRWGKRDIAHLEASLAYRTLIGLHQQAARELAAAAPHSVISAFPLFPVLSAPPEDGYLPAPLPVKTPEQAAGLKALCESDFIVEAQDSSVQPALAELRRVGALTLWRQLGPPPMRDFGKSSADSDLSGQAAQLPLDAERDLTVRIYRISCPPTIKL